MLVQTSREQFAIINFSAIQSLAGCTRAEILTFNALALHANPDGHCWPGRERLSHITQLSESRISKATSGLERKGLIRKEINSGIRVDYYLLQQPLQPMGARLPEPLPVSITTPAQNGTPPLPKTAPRTAHSSNQGTERAAQPESAPVEPQVQAPLSAPVLRTPVPPRPVKTAPPECVPEDWIVIGAGMRPELDATVIQASAEKFLDDRRSKGFVLVDWTPAWKNWIRNERGPKPVNPQGGSRPAYAIERPNPASSWIPGQPANRGPKQTPEQIQADFEKNMIRLGATFDPATGIWMPKHAAKPRPAPVTPEVVKPPMTPTPRADSPFRRDAMIVIRAIDSGMPKEQVKELELELKRRREAMGGDVSGDG